jgi:wyosine [tRNA(Phe)-imidazoG37] synthetase (radical SAM superfamily)
MDYTIMENKETEAIHFNNKATVYGPVKSWRFGQSLGIDPIYITSTCSFNCFYCQLGQIQNITTEWKEYVPTQKVIDDLSNLLKQGTPIDVITYSGSGEPTLASNLGDLIKEVRKLTPKTPQYILTNATELHRPEVRKNLMDLDKIIVKLDAGTEELFQRMNRPAKGVSLEKVMEGILKLKEEYSGSIEVQSMFLPFNQVEIDSLAKLLQKIQPELVQLNTPKRPYPLSWHRENRGNHKLIFDYETRVLKGLTPDQAKELETQLKEKTGLEFTSIYRS